MQHKIMKVVSISNLVSSENKKKGFNFQTMASNSFALPHDFTKWEPMHICKHEAICSVMTAELWISPLRNTYSYTKQQNQKRPAINWKKKFVLFWKCIIFPIIC